MTRGTTSSSPNINRTEEEEDTAIREVVEEEGDTASREAITKAAVEEGEEVPVAEAGEGEGAEAVVTETISNNSSSLMALPSRLRPPQAPPSK